MSYPSVEYKGKSLYQIGCRNCKDGIHWRIYTDGENFIAKCGNCDHTIEIVDKSLVNKSD